MAPSLDIARYLIHLASPGESEDSDCLCHMRLQKLLYYVQGWHLASLGTPLFTERIEAWKFGPVVRDLYYQFNSYGYQAIPPTAGADTATLTERQKVFIRSIWSKYKVYSATALRDMTHREAPWVNARGGLSADARSDAEITQQAMLEFFSAMLANRLKAQDPRINPATWEASAKAMFAGRTKTAKEISLELHRRRARPNQ